VAKDHEGVDAWDTGDEACGRHSPLPENFWYRGVNIVGFFVRFQSYFNVAAGINQPLEAKNTGAKGNSQSSKDDQPHAPVNSHLGTDIDDIIHARSRWHYLMTRKMWAARAARRNMFPKVGRSRGQNAM